MIEGTLRFTFPQFYNTQISKLITKQTKQIKFCRFHWSPYNRIIHAKLLYSVLVLRKGTYMSIKQEKQNNIRLGTKNKNVHVRYQPRIYITLNLSQLSRHFKYHPTEPINNSSNLRPIPPFLSQKSNKKLIENHERNTRVDNDTPKLNGIYDAEVASSFQRFRVNYPAEAIQCPVDLHSISMTTRM